MTRGDESTQLSRALVELRGKRRQVDVVAATGLSQSQLSRIEQGRSLPTEDEAARLLDLYGTSASRRAEILGWVRDARAGVTDERLVVQRGRTLAMQQRWGRMERGATVVRAFQTSMIAGELQTPEYAAVVFGQPPDSTVVVERLERRRALLAEPQRRHVLVQTEGSLLVPMGSARVMSEQLDALIEASRLPNVELGVLTPDVPVEAMTPAGFYLYDDTAAVVGLKVASATLTTPADVSAFSELFDRLAAAAVFGDEARAAVERIAARYR